MPTGYSSSSPNYPDTYPAGTVQYPAASQPHSPVPYGAAPYDPSSYSPPAYGQPPYAAPGYGSPYPMGVAPRNGMGTAALVLGIIAVVLSVTVWGGVILGILAIIFGSVGMGRARRGEATNRGSAMAGLILGIVAIALLVLLVIVGFGLYATSTGAGR